MQDLSASNHDPAIWAKHFEGTVESSCFDDEPPTLLSNHLLGTTPQATVKAVAIGYSQSRGNHDWQRQYQRQCQQQDMSGMFSGDSQRGCNDDGVWAQ